MKENIDPRMHTAEHILNQTIVRLFNTGRCFSAHIEKKKSKCDYHFNRALTPEEIKMVEDKVNEIINLDLPVTDRQMPITEAQTKFNLERLPAEERNNSEIKIVSVGDYDAVPCIGGHVSSTKEIGQFKIISSDFNEGVLRIRYKLIS